MVLRPKGILEIFQTFLFNSFVSDALCILERALLKPAHVLDKADVYLNIDETKKMKKIFESDRVNFIVVDQERQNKYKHLNA